MKIVESSSDEEEEEEKMKISSSGKQAKLSSQPDTGTVECIVEENKLYPNDDQNFVQFHFAIICYHALFHNVISITDKFSLR